MSTVESEIGSLFLQVQSMSPDAWPQASALIRRMVALDPEHGKPYLAVALAQLKAGTLERASDLMGELGQRDGPGRVYGMGVVAFLGGRKAEAEQLLRRALATYEQLGHIAGQAAAHTGLGLVFKDRGELGAAVTEYEAALALNEQLGYAPDRADILHNLATIEIKQGLWQAALERERGILDIRRQAEDVAGQAQSLSNIAASLQRLGRTAEAISTLETCFDLRREIGSVPAQISTLRQIARLLVDSGQPQRAVERLHQARELAAPYDEGVIHAEIRINLGEALSAAGDKENAIPLLEKAAAALERFERPARQAAALVRLGRVRIDLGQLHRAEADLSRALLLAERGNSAATQIEARIARARARAGTGQLDLALADQEQALALARAHERRPDEVNSLNNLATIHYRLGRRDRAVRYVDESLSLASELGERRGEARARHNRAVLQAEAGHVEAALAELRETIELWEALGNVRSAAMSRLSAAEVVLQLDRPQEALRLAGAALAGHEKAGDLPGRAVTRNIIGAILLATGETALARDEHAAALQMAKAAELAEEAWRAHAGMSRALDAAGDVAGARREALAALDAIERVRGSIDTGVLRVDFLSDKVVLYERALALVAGRSRQAGGKAVAATFALAERARARGLVDLLAEARAQISGTLSPELRAREADLIDRMNAAAVQLSGTADDRRRAAARGDLERAEEEMDLLRLEIRRAAPLAAEALYPEPLTLQDLQTTVLREGEQLLQYFIGEHGAWLWSIDRDSARLHRLADPSVIRAQVEAALDALTSAAPGLGDGSERALRRLARTLLPVSLAHGRRLLVAPDGLLYHLPFGALRRRDRYLIEDHEITIVPSATTLALLRRSTRPRPEAGVLAIGAPATGDDARFPPLPFSSEEVKGVAALFPEGRRRTLQGLAATRAGLQGAGPGAFRFLHFATHGWLDAEVPRHSGLVLGPAGDGEPFDLLTVQDILGLDLAAEAVVLSSCRSGLGELLKGEGLIGLTRAFLNAGSRSVVVSLWDVSDRSTSDLMIAFYRGLQAGERVGAALRQAKLAFLESDRPARRQARVWASFVVVGDPSGDEKVMNRASDRSTSNR